MVSWGRWLCAAASAAVPPTLGPEAHAAFCSSVVMVTYIHTHTHMLCFTPRRMRQSVLNLGGEGPGPKPPRTDRPDFSEHRGPQRIGKRGRPVDVRGPSAQEPSRYNTLRLAPASGPVPGPMPCGVAPAPHRSQAAALLLDHLLTAMKKMTIFHSNQICIILEKVSETRPFFISGSVLSTEAYT